MNLLWRRGDCAITAAHSDSAIKLSYDPQIHDIISRRILQGSERPAQHGNNHNAGTSSLQESRLRWRRLLGAEGADAATLMSAHQRRRSTIVMSKRPADFPGRWRDGSFLDPACKSPVLLHAKGCWHTRRTPGTELNNDRWPLWSGVGEVGLIAVPLSSREAAYVFGPLVLVRSG
jgi:hypothetical protein